MKRFKRLFLIFFIYCFFTAGTYAGIPPEIEIHGYISQGFLISNRNNYLADTENGTFQFNELGINFTMNLADKLQVGIQLAARDLGDTGNDKVIIDWGFADYRWQDWLGFRVGKIKLPMGFYNKTRDIDMVRNAVLLPQSIYSETFRDTLTAMKGISGYGDVPLKALGDISYEALLGTMEIDKDSTTTKGVEARGGFKVDSYEVGKLLCWSVIWETPLEGLRLGASQINTELKVFGPITDDITVPVPFPPYTITVAEKGMTMITDSPDYLKTIYSLEYTWGNLVLAAEYARQDQKLIIRIADLEPIERLLKFDSFYGRASYRFSDWLEAGAYYSVFYRDRNDRDGTGTPYDPPFIAFQKDTCLTFRFDLNSQWAFKLEGHLMNGTALCFPQDNLNDDGVPQFDKKWYLLAAKMTFVF